MLGMVLCAGPPPAALGCRPAVDGQSSAAPFVCDALSVCVHQLMLPFPPPHSSASYDNVLAIDASHWRSLLNKAVVQVRQRAPSAAQPAAQPSTSAYPSVL